MKRYMAVDVGGTSIKYGVVLEDGTLDNNGKIKIPKNLDGFYDKIKKIVEGEKDLEGVAFSFPGAVDDEKGYIGGSSAVPYIHGFNMKKELEERVGMKVTMENDANCAALGEVWKGVGADKNDSIFMVIGSGIGGAIVKDRNLHKGANLHGGEFGYGVTYDEKEGRYRTWSGIASTGAVVRSYRRKTGKILSGEEIFKRGDNKEREALEVLDKFYKDLGILIFNLQYTYDPEVIGIGGGISAREDIVEKIYEKVDDIIKSIKVAKIRPNIKRCAAGNNSNLIGAVYYYKTREDKGC